MQVTVRDGIYEVTPGYEALVDWLHDPPADAAVVCIVNPNDEDDVGPAFVFKEMTVSGALAAGFDRATEILPSPDGILNYLHAAVHEIVETDPQLVADYAEEREALLDVVPEEFRAACEEIRKVVRQRD